MSYSMIIGIAAGACLITAFVAVLLDYTYEAGFDDGFAQGMRCGNE